MLIGFENWFLRPDVIECNEKISGNFQQLWLLVTLGIDEI